MNFKPFQKIARLKRSCIVTEKIDGTNVQICIELKANLTPEELSVAKYQFTYSEFKSWIERLVNFQCHSAS